MIVISFLFSLLVWLVLVKPELLSHSETTPVNTILATMTLPDLLIFVAIFVVVAGAMKMFMRYRLKRKRPAEVKWKE